MRTFDPSALREVRDAGEPLYAAVAAATEATACHRDLGLDATAGPLAFRAVALLAGSVESATAMLFDYAPDLVARTLSTLDDVADPDAFVPLRLDIADRALRRLLGDAVADSAMVEAAALARTAAQAAGENPAGRPLFAANAALPWPEEPHLVLWHALMLLHEWWHDARVATLLAEGRSGIESLVEDAAEGDRTPQSLRTAHGWPDGEWKAAVARLRGRGILLADGDPVALALTDPVLLELSDAGRAQRRRIGEQTETIAAGAYEPLGRRGCARLRELCTALTHTMSQNDDPVDDTHR